MLLPSNQLQNGLAEEEELNYSEQEEEESLETDPQPGYSMAPHKWEIKWRKRAEEKINEGLGGKQASTSINYHPQQSEEVVPAAENGISMKKKRSSFALDEVVGASIPMADDLTAITSHISSPQQCPQVYYRSSSSCSSSTSQYDNHNYYNVAQEISEADKYQGKNRYISRRSAPLACDDDLLSDSEISDLEKKVARGDFSSPVTYEEAELKAEEYGLQTQQNSEHAAYSTANTTSGNISGSASMPCFSSTAIQTEHLQNIWLDCVEEKEKALVNQTKHPSAMLRSATMTSSNTNRCKPINQFESKWMPPQRRMLPLRPDEVVREKLQIATSEPQKLATLKQEAKPKPSRRLPQIPPQPFRQIIHQQHQNWINWLNSHQNQQQPYNLITKSSGIQNLVQRPRP
uniref:Uncharacterized protein n=1 Tax=Ditylenchus dipsaci TaxID=166011 RepID=A0A915DHZ3_9BILA